MGRNARTKSESSVYHIVLRGNNRQQIFLDSEDYKQFLTVLSDCKRISKFSLYAYCLMGNHIHLLIKEKEESIDLIIKRILNRYVYWYNYKYRRNGHLFQGRYLSECVENEDYFFKVIRYIHQNPVKAHICKKSEEYKYSSFSEYFDEESLQPDDFKLCSVNAVFKMTDKESLYEFSMSENDDTCLDLYRSGLYDEEAMLIIKVVTGCKTPAEIQSLPAEEQKIYIRKLKAKGLSIRQLSRLTGLSINIIRYS